MVNLEKESLNQSQEIENEKDSLNDLESQRKMTEWSEKDFVTNRFQIWLGNKMPKTIAAKELIDNGLDQLADKKKKTNKLYIKLTPQSVMVMDNGKGISLDRDTSSGQSHLFLAVAKLYTSTNYDGTENMTGNNGVGATINNFFSSKFVVGHVKNNKDLLGYEFLNGEHKNNGLSEDNLTVDHINPNFDNGFYVQAEYLSDYLKENIDIKWLLEYTKYRVGELKLNSQVYIDYSYETSQNLLDEESNTSYDLVNFESTYGNGDSFNKIEYNKVESSPNYVKSWLENAKDRNLSIIKYKGFTYAFGKEVEDLNGMKSIVQGAPVNQSPTFKYTFEIEDYNVPVAVPYSLYYSGKTAPNYTDQSKVSIRTYVTNHSSALNKSVLFSFFKKKAEEYYIAHQLKNNDATSYTPAVGQGYKELIIAEGYSAITGIKAMRNAKTQATLFLRGVIMNTYSKELKSAMKSPVVNELLTVLNKEKFDKIILAVDADVHGSHIAGLLIGLFARFQPHFLTEGKLFYCNTPFYIFNKGKEMKWSDNKEDLPKGYHLKTNKGLGGLTPQEIKQFIINDNTRELWRIDYDKDFEKTEEALYNGLVSCGKKWVINDERNIAFEDKAWEYIEDLQLKEIDKNTKAITISNFFETKYREYWKKTNQDKNAFFPEEQLTAVNRHLIWAASKLGMYKGSVVKTPELAAEIVKTHIASNIGVEDSVKGAAVEYRRQPGTRLLRGIGNMGSFPGDTGAAARYTSVQCTPLLDKMIKDIPYMDILVDEEGTKYPDWISTPLPMFLINGTNQIGDGYSCYVAERDAREVLNWIKDFHESGSDEHKIPDATSFAGCDVWFEKSNGYVQYVATMKQEGKYDVITSLPPGVGVYNAILKIKKKLPKSVADRVLDAQGEGDLVRILVPNGYITKDNMHLYGLHTARKEQIYIWDKEADTMRLSTFKYVAKKWFKKRKEIVIKRLSEEKDKLTSHIKRIDLIKLYVDKNMNTWKVSDIEEYLGVEDANIVLSTTARSFLPENLSKNEILRDEYLSKIESVEDNIENIGDYVLNEAFDLLKANEEFFEYYNG